jgi:hypothetical protein
MDHQVSLDSFLTTTILQHTTKQNNHQESLGSLLIIIVMQHIAKQNNHQISLSSYTNWHKWKRMIKLFVTC